MNDEKNQHKSFTAREGQHEDNLTFGQEGQEDYAPDDNMTPQPDETADRFQELQTKYDELNDSYLRLHAEFDNFRKRSLKEKADIVKSGGERVLTEIIGLVDDFERALGAIHQTEDKQAMLEGIDLIYGKFVGFLAQHGVKEIEAVGQPFDPEKFEAITTVPVQDPSQSGKVIDCIQKGYELNGKIIRFPKVIVGE